MVRFKSIILVVEKSLNDDVLKCLEYEDYEYVNSDGETVVMKIAELKKRTSFFERLLKARETQPKGSRWRVLGYEPNGERLGLNHWDNCRMFTTKNGSTIAIQNDGTIISVCKNYGSDDNMKALIQFAVEQGGNKLDTFDGNYGFYRYCGFEPMTWTPFESYSDDGPYDWSDGASHREPILFMGYTGKSEKLGSDDVIAEKTQFYGNNVPFTGDNAYEDGVSERNRLVEML